MQRRHASSEVQQPTTSNATWASRNRTSAQLVAFLFRRPSGSAAIRAVMAPMSGPDRAWLYDGSVNGELALMAALAANGGRWLRDGARGPVPELSNGNSSFQYVGSFTAQVPSWGFRRRASTVASAEEWLIALHSRAVTDLSLITDLPIGVLLPPHVASAFSNSGTWALLATGKEAPRIWTIRWEVGDRNAPDSRIWSLAARNWPGEGLEAPQVEVAEARNGLRAALSEIQTFAERFDELNSWASWFTTAETLLDDPAPAAPYHRDLLPRDASLDRRQLAAAVVQGWVFGGMGSWNDGGLLDPADQREYERVGANLYTALLVALPAAANGS